MIETRREHGRWAAVVLGCAENHDRAGRTGVVALTLFIDPERRVADEERGARNGDTANDQEVAKDRPTVQRSPAWPCAARRQAGRWTAAGRSAAGRPDRLTCRDTSCI
jgi:hypothetical protein